MARVLVIDDDDLVRETLGFMVESVGHSAILAASYADGLREMEARPAEVVIVDMYMPDRSGIEVVGELRQRFPGIPIIAMSGGGDAGGVEVLKAASDAGAAAVLRKPFGPDELADTITRVLSTHV